MLPPYLIFSGSLEDLYTDAELAYVCSYCVECIYIYIRYAVDIQLLFLIGHLYLIGVWCGEDHRINTIEAQCLK